MTEVVKSKEKRVISAKKITILAIMLALTLIFSFVPISFGTVTLALMIIPTLIIALSQDFLTTLVMGVMLGIINFIAWYTTKAASPIAPIFQNPVICILPRMLIGIVAYFVNYGFNKLFGKIKNKEKSVALEDDGAIKNEDSDNEEFASFKKKERPIEVVSSGIATACGVLTNTLFVSLFTIIFFNNKMLGTFVINIEYILTWFGLNFVIEIISFTLIIPPIVYALKKAKLV